VVTFVTERELGRLDQIANKEDRSLSAIVHRIIVRYLENIGPSENSK
jgi:predicted transcriptional regulator